MINLPFFKVSHFKWLTFTRSTNSKIIVTFLLITISCTKEISMDFDDLNKSLVVNSIFNTKEPFKFKFSYSSSPVNNYENINDSLQFILYANNIIVLDTIVDSKELQTKLYPQSNVSYSVEIITQDFTAIFSSDSIPRLIQINEAKIKVPAGIDEYGEEYAEATISFLDPYNETNYYELLLYSLSNNEIDNYWQCFGDCEITDPVLLNEGDIDYLPTTYFFSDELFNGKKYTMRIRSSGGGYGQNNGVTLRSVSRNYYLYRKYFTRHAHNQQFQGDFLDIVFMGEPQSMFTNIINGYGIFAGYQETSAALIEIK